MYSNRTDMNSLKIKRLSLGAEARILRQQIKRAGRKNYQESMWSMQSHLDGVVKQAARCAHLAHAFLKVMPYARVEDPVLTKTKPTVDVPSALNAPSICANIRTFGGAQYRKMDKADLARAVQDWIDGGAPASLGASNPRPAGSTPAVVAI